MMKVPVPPLSPVDAQASGSPAQAGPSLIESYWPAPNHPASIGVWVIATSLAAVGALTLAKSAPGAHFAVLSTAFYLYVLVSHQKNRGPGRLQVTLRGALAIVALLLTWVAVLRDNTNNQSALWGAGLLLTLASTDARTWRQSLWAPMALTAAMFRAPTWLRATLTEVARPKSLGPAIKGSLLAVGIGLPVLILLASADDSFSRFLTNLGPTVDLPNFIIRSSIFIALMIVICAVFFLISAPLKWPKKAISAHRTLAEWALPMATVVLILGLFIAVQLAVLFGGYTANFAVNGITAADRARQGFGQLVVVTMIGLALLAWAAEQVWAADSRRATKVFWGLGGGLVALLLLVVASAIRRLWLYQESFGWTVARLHAAAMELWLGAALILLAVLWVLRRPKLATRSVALLAGVWLLALSLLSPDALVAHWNVERFERTGKIDVAYLSSLSADGVPRLARLPEPQRSVVLSSLRINSDNWYSWNYSRARGRSILRELDLGNSR